MRRIQFGSKFKTNLESHQTEQKENQNDDREDQKPRVRLNTKRMKFVKGRNIFVYFICIADCIGSKMGEICVWQDQGPIIYDAIGAHDSEKIVVATTRFELLQKLMPCNFLHVFIEFTVQRRCRSASLID